LYLKDFKPYLVVLTLGTAAVYISEMCKKASRQLNILKRIGKYMNRLRRLTSYYSFILSNFNYCPVIWHYCSEKIQLKWKKSKNVHCGKPYLVVLTLGTAAVFFDLKL
jgi:hypothetical protein